MRNRVVLIKGSRNLSNAITIGHHQRINADHVVAICALKRPHFLPLDFDLKLETLNQKITELVKHWKSIDQEHYLISEYAQTVVDHGRSDIKAVEGISLNVPWFYETVQTLHRSFGQHVVGVKIIENDFEEKIAIGKTNYTREEFTELLQPQKWLG